MQGTVIRLTLVALGTYCVVLLGYGLGQRKILFQPSHQPNDRNLARWLREGKLIGFERAGPDTSIVWLLLHGNAGQASHRVYALPFFPAEQPVFILEYPGYGARAGSPSRESINQAAEEGYRDLRRRFPQARVGVVGESIGSGPACHLGTLPHPPDKIVLVTPFDNLVSVARDHLPFLPVGLLLRDRWDNAAALATYSGPVEIFGAKRDGIIPVRHAVALAQALPRATLHLADCDHNDWVLSGAVRFRLP